MISMGGDPNSENQLERYCKLLLASSTERVRVLLL